MPEKGGTMENDKLETGLPEGMPEDTAKAVKEEVSAGSETADNVDKAGQMAAPDAVNTASETAEEPRDAASEKTASAETEKDMTAEETISSVQNTVSSTAGEASARKNKSPLMIVAVLAVLAVVAVLACIVFGFGGRGFQLRFSSPESNFQRISEEELQKGAGGLARITDEIKAQGKLAGNSESDGSYTLTFSDNGKTLVKSMTGMDISWFSSVKMGLNMLMNKGKIDAKYAVDLNDNNILNMNVFLGDNEAAVDVPELFKQPLGLDEEELKLAFGGQSFSAYMQNLISSYENLPEGKVYGNLYEKYGKIVLGSYQSVMKSEGQVSAGEISQKGITFTAHYDAEAIRKMSEKLRDTMKEDTELKEAIIQSYDAFSWYFQSLRNLQGNPSFYDNEEMIPKDGAALYEQFLKGLDEAGMDVAEGSEMDILYKVDEKGNLIGGGIRLKGGEEDLLLFDHSAPKQGNKHGLSYQLEGSDEKYTLQGVATVSGNEISGDYVLMRGEDTLLNIRLEDVVLLKQLMGKSSGSITVSPTAGADSAGLGLSGYSLKLQFDSDSAKDSSKGSYALSLLNDNGELVRLDFDATVKPHQEELTNPYPEAKKAEDVDALIDKDKIDSFIQKLKDSGVPENYTSSLYFALMLMSSD